jgi:hypothetical protein
LPGEGSERAARCAAEAQKTRVQHASNLLFVCCEMAVRSASNYLYFYDSYLNRVNMPNLRKYIRLVNSNLRGFAPLRGLDKISPKTRFCTNFGAIRSNTPHNSTSVIPSGRGTLRFVLCPDYINDGCPMFRALCETWDTTLSLASNPHCSAWRGRPHP